MGPEKIPNNLIRLAAVAAAIGGSLAGARAVEGQTEAKEPEVKVKIATLIDNGNNVVDEQDKGFSQWVGLWVDEDGNRIIDANEAFTAHMTDENGLLRTTLTGLGPGVRVCAEALRIPDNLGPINGADCKSVDPEGAVSLELLFKEKAKELPRSGGPPANNRNFPPLGIIALGSGVASLGLGLLGVLKGRRNRA